MNRPLWLLQSSPSPIAPQCFWFLRTLVPIPRTLSPCIWLHCLLTFVGLIPANWEMPLQHTIPLHKGRSFPMALFQSGTVCCLQRVQSHIQHPDYFLPKLFPAHCRRSLRKLKKVWNAACKCVCPYYFNLSRLILLPFPKRYLFRWQNSIYNNPGLTLKRMKAA